MSPATAIWSRLLQAADPALTREMARFVLSIQFSDAERSRLRELAGRDHFDLSYDDEQEYAALVHANTALMLLQSKARLILSSAPS